MTLDFLLLLEPFSDNYGFASNISGGKIGLSFSSLGKGSDSILVPSGKIFYHT